MKRPDKAMCCEACAFWRLLTEWGWADVERSRQKGRCQIHGFNTGRTGFCGHYVNSELKSEKAA